MFINKWIKSDILWLNIYFWTLNNLKDILGIYWAINRYLNSFSLNLDQTVSC